MKLSSPAFLHGGEIPLEFTCLGSNINPPLHVSDIPKGTRTFVLLMEDADAKPAAWTHWLVFNIPAALTEWPAGAVPEGATEALANNHSFGYEGPCPRYFQGTHHYWFRAYGLDGKLDLPAGSERDVVWQKMQGHITGEAFLLGLCTSGPGLP